MFATKTKEPKKPKEYGKLIGLVVRVPGFFLW